MQFLVRFVADWLMVPVVLVSLYTLVWRVPNRLRYARYCYILMAGATAYTLAKVAGLLWQPEQLRPFELIGAEPGAAYLNVFSARCLVRYAQPPAWDNVSRFSGDN